MPASDESDIRSISNRHDAVPSQSAPASPSTFALRSAGLRLLRRGYHSEAELLFRSAVAASDKPDFVARATEDMARAILPRLPLQALELLRTLETDCPTHRDTTSMINLRGRIFYELYDLPRAREELLKAKASAEKSKNDIYVGYTLANLAAIDFEEGKAKLARDAYRRANEIFAENDNRTASTIVLCNMAIHSIILGHFEEVMDIIDDVESETEEIKSPWLLGWYEYLRGEIELILGERVQAFGFFDRAYKHASVAFDSTIQAKSLTWKTVLGESRDPVALLEDLENAAEDLYSRGLRSDSASVLLIAARFAEWKKLEGGARRKVAHGILGDPSYGRMLDSHYDRLFRPVLSRGSRPRSRSLPRFCTTSAPLIVLKKRVARLAATDVRLLIEGESGTGKSFLAGLIHRKGRGRKKPFIVVDCTNLEENLFESKLFGHMRGAFTGAVSNSVGLVEQADGGTLFLDEIGELPPGIQAKLLYTIEEQRFRPVGARMEKTADFRVIAATNRDIDGMLEEGALRRDLYYRIAGFRVHIPPLRERREDIVPLAELQLERLNERYGRKKVLRPGVWEILIRYDWPGNVRELNAALERGFHLAVGRRIAVEDLGLGLSLGDGAIEDLTWDTVRRDHLLNVLRLCRGNVTRSAKVLEMNRTTLIYKLKQLGIDRSDFDPSHQPEDVVDHGSAAAPSLRLVADRESGKAPDQGSDGADRAID